MIDRRVEFKKFFGKSVSKITAKKSSTAVLYLYNFFKKFSMNSTAIVNFLPEFILSDNFTSIELFYNFQKTFISYSDSEVNQIHNNLFNFKSFFKFNTRFKKKSKHKTTVFFFKNSFFLFDVNFLTFSKFSGFIKSLSKLHSPYFFNDLIGIKTFDLYNYEDFYEDFYESDLAIQLDTSLFVPFDGRYVLAESGDYILRKPFPNFFTNDFDFLKQYIYLNFVYVFKRLKFRLFSNSSTLSSAFLFGLLNKAYAFSMGRSVNRKFKRYATYFQDSHKINTALFSNKTPYSSLPEFFRVLVFRKIKGQTVPNFFKFFYLYITSFLEFFLKEKIFFRVIPIKKKVQPAKRRLNRIFAKRRYFQSKVGRGFFLNEMLEILHLTFLFKDLNFLKRWFLLTMERIQFEKHRKFLSVFKHIVSKFPKALMKKNKVKGFFLDVRGKVGVTGDAKKRNFFVSVGKRSKTTKNSKYDYQQGIVRTETGALGITMIMYY